jgi:hypothetical protein
VQTIPVEVPVVPAVALGSSPERTQRPELGATDVAAVALAAPAAPKSFVELLDASLGV